MGSFRQLKLSTVDQTIRKYFFQAFTSLHLVQNDILMFILIFISIKCPERHFRNEILEIDRYTHVFAILILPVTLAPPTGFHALKRREILRVSISSGPFRCRVLLLGVPDCRFISNYSMVSRFFSLFSGVIILTLYTG